MGDATITTRCKMEHELMGASNIQRLLRDALLKKEPWGLDSGQVMYFLPKTDNAGTLQINDGTYSMDVKLVGASAANNILFDNSDDQLEFDGIDVTLGDNDLFVLGDDRDVVVQYDAQETSPCLEFIVQSPVKGLLNLLSTRYELKWVAGARGLPQLNAVTDPPAGDTYNTAAITALLNADREFEILGTNASSDDVTAYAEGGIKLETDGADNDQVIVLPHLNTGQSAWTSVTWGTDEETEWSCHIRTGSAVTAMTIWAGLKLTNTSVTATDDDQAFFRYAAATNSGKWQAISSIAGTDDAADAGVTVAANTDYHLCIKIDSSRIATFYINGVLVETSAALTSTDLIPYIGIHANTGAAKHMYVLGQSISRVIG